MKTSSGISIRVRGLEAVEDFLKSLPRGVKKIAVTTIATYLIGDERHGLRHEPAPKYVSRKDAGYTTSKKQLAYFFAVGILERTAGGGVKLNRYKRSGKTSDSWGYTETNDGASILNPAAGAYWTQDNEKQARQPGKVGWRKTAQNIKDNWAGAMRSAMAEVHKWIQQKGG